MALGRYTAVFALLGLILHCCSGSIVLADPLEATIRLVVNGEAVATDVPPLRINDRVMVPVRFVSEALEAEVAWDPDTRTVIVESAGFEGTSDPHAAGAGMLPGIKVMVDGELITGDVPPQMLNDRVMVPVRFVSEALGATVEWDTGSASVLIASAPEGFIRYISVLYGITLVHLETWHPSTAPVGGVRLTRDGEGQFYIEAGSRGDDPFFSPERLCESAAKTHFPNTGVVIQEMTSYEVPAITSRVIEAYRKYRVISDGEVFLVERWAFYSRGGLGVLDMVYAANPSGTGPADEQAWAEGKAILESVKLTRDQYTFTYEHTYPEWALTFTLTGAWIKTVERPGVTVVFAHGTELGLGVAVGQVPTGTTTAACVEQLRSNLQILYGSSILLGGVGPTTLAGRDGLLVNYTLVLGGVSVYCGVHVVVSGNQVLAVTLSSLTPPPLSPRVQEGLRNILDSIIWSPTP